MGSLLLFVGNFLQTLISAAGVIVIARLLGPENYGVFTLSFVIPTLIQLFLGLGVNTAVTRYAAYYISVGKPDKAKRFARNAILFVLLFGGLLSILNYAVAGPLSSVILGRSNIVVSIVGIGNNQDNLSEKYFTGSYPQIGHPCVPSTLIFWAYCARRRL